MNLPHKEHGCCHNTTPSLIRFNHYPLYINSSIFVLIVRSPQLIRRL
eukprot:UN11092